MPGQPVAADQLRHEEILVTSYSLKVNIKQLVPGNSPSVSRHQLSAIRKTFPLKQCHTGKHKRYITVNQENITYNTGISKPMSRNHFPRPAIPFFPFIIKRPDRAKKTRDTAKKSPITFHPFTRL